MLNMMIAHYSNGNKARFAAKIGAKPQTVSAWLARETFDFEQLYDHLEGLSGDWLLSGGFGKMLRNPNPQIVNSDIEKEKISLSLELADILKRIIDLNK